MGTMWLHNNALRASNVYQYSKQLPSSLSIFRAVWGDLGVKMLYLNSMKRVTTIAITTAVLGVVDIFA